MHIDSKECLKKDQLINHLAANTNILNQDAADIVEELLNIMKSAFSKGINVELGSEFGCFLVKYQEGYKNENSPRIPKSDRYTVIFKPSKKLKNCLMIVMLVLVRFFYDYVKIF